MQKSLLDVFLRSCCADVFDGISTSGMMQETVAVSVNKIES
jgi:hypothetical protein